MLSQPNDDADVALGGVAGDGPLIGRGRLEMSQSPGTETPTAEAELETKPPAATASRVIPNPAEQPNRGEEISLLALVNILFRRYKLVAGLPIGTSSIAIVIALLQNPQYTATVLFVPETETGAAAPGGLAGIAAQFGVNVGGNVVNSPDFFADVLTSRTLRDQVLQTKFPDPTTQAPGDSASLLDILEIEKDTETERLEFGREILAGAVSVGVSPQTGIVSVSVETEYRPLSAQVANLFVDLLDEFNSETRQLNAESRRRFVEVRVTDTERELSEAEENLQRFLERNRLWRGSPELVVQYERIQRQVTIKQEVLITLSRQYEEARIQEVNDTPLITVIDRAVPPERKSSPRRRLMVIQWFLAGAVFALFAAIAQEYVERAAKRDEPEFRELSSHWEAIKAKVPGTAARRRARP